MKEVREECGIVGIYLKNPEKNRQKLPTLLYLALKELQHRGQESAGISTLNLHDTNYERKLKVLKKVGRVDDLFKPLFKPKLSEETKEFIKNYQGKAGIGHVRYATAGSPTDYYHRLEEAQPFLRRHGRAVKRFAIAFNGNLANYDILEDQMKQEGYDLETHVDTEIIMHLLSLELNKKMIVDNLGKKQKPNMFEVSEEVMKKLDGAYNVISLFADGDLISWRDPFGLRPLVWGENSEMFGIASESVALTKIGIENFFPVEPGSCMIFNSKGLESKVLFPGHKKAHCNFELVYFARADSVIEGVSVNKVRENLGKELAKTDPLRDYIQKNKELCVVVPVPDTAISAAEGYAEEANIRWTMAIKKNEASRGFINKPEDRARIMHQKYSIIEEKIKNKIAIIIEDSIYRGETTKIIVEKIKKAGAKEVHIRSTQPQIRHPCFYGIDSPTYEELIAAKFEEKEAPEKIAQYCGADSIFFLSIENHAKSIGIGSENICRACLTGTYPTLHGNRLAEKARKNVPERTRTSDPTVSAKDVTKNDEI